jgi:rare lipoprotein A
MRALLACVLSLLAGCTLRPGAPVSPHYVVGAPYETGGVWRYPREDFSLDETGIATETASSTVRVTADGEPNDPTALIAQHRTLQLPAIVQVTNLENGRQILVRVNDRGPADPARAIALSHRAMVLLAAADPRAVRVRIQVVNDESRMLANALLNRPDAPAVPEAPRIQVAAAPSGKVAAESLAPPPGARGSAGLAPAAPGAIAAAVATPAEIPLRLPETVRAVYVRPGTLAVDCGSFGRLEYAEVLRRRIARLNPRVSTDYNAPRDAAYIVRLGPFATLAEAEGALRQALAAGVPDARIVVE